MNEPTWVPQDAVPEIHAAQLAEHGGLPGIRDPNALASALARPENLFAYVEPDLARLAASYAFGLARNHAFSDGNKLTALVVAAKFGGLNGRPIAPPQDEIVAFVLALAAGELGEDAAAAWFRARLS